MRGPGQSRYGVRLGLVRVLAAVAQVPGGEDERAAAGDGGEGGDRGEQRGGHGDQADPDDRYRDSEVDAYVEGRADFGALPGWGDAGQIVLCGEEGHAVAGASQ